MEYEPLAHVSLAGQARLAFLEQQFGGSLAWCLSNFSTSLFKLMLERPSQCVYAAIDMWWVCGQETEETHARELKQVISSVAMNPMTRWRHMRLNSWYCIHQLLQVKSQVEQAHQKLGNHHSFPLRSFYHVLSLPSSVMANLLLLVSCFAQDRPRLFATACYIARQGQLLGKVDGWLCWQTYQRAWSGWKTHMLHCAP